MKTISKETAFALMDAFAAAYMETHELFCVYEKDKENIENAARLDFLNYCIEKNIDIVHEEEG